MCPVELSLLCFQVHFIRYQTEVKQTEIGRDYLNLSGDIRNTTQVQPTGPLLQSVQSGRFHLNLSNEITGFCVPLQNVLRRSVLLNRWTDHGHSSSVINLISHNICDVFLGVFHQCTSTAFTVLRQYSHRDVWLKLQHTTSIRDVCNATTINMPL